MTATAHVLIGGAIAASVKDPILGTTLAFLSHPLLDMIPHWDFGRGWKEKSKARLFVEASLDLAVGLVLTYLIFGQLITNIWYFLAAVFASVVLDIAQIPYWFWGWKFFPFSTAYLIQSKIQGRAKMPLGILTQVVSILVIVAILNSISLN